MGAKDPSIGGIGVAVPDGDAAKLSKRKTEMDEALKEAGKRVRSKGEPIALPVPTWSIENSDLLTP